MRRDSTFIIIVTSILGVMIVGFTTMMIFVSNNKSDMSTATVLAKENEEEQMEGLIERSPFVDGVNIYADKYQEEIDVSDEAGGISFVVLSEDEIDAALEDAMERDMEVESEYKNTVELLPSIFNKREQVAKARVDQSGFKDSYASDDCQKIEFTFADEEGKKQDFYIVVPTHVYLYNAGRTESNSYTIRIETNLSDDTKIKRYGWVTADTSKVTLSAESGREVTVTRKADHIGDSEVSLLMTYFTGPKTTATAEASITVTVIGVQGDDSLKDIDGELLFVDAAGKKGATYNDFNSYDYFYGAVKTTGWQKVEGKTYYYDRNSEPVTGRQVIGSYLYTFDEKGVLTGGMAGERGIDVSKYQKDIDWQQVAASGVSFAIIRCGYRGAVGAQLVEDPYFEKNIMEAKAAGLKVGVYFFTQAVTVEEARQEASMAMALCKDYKLDLPIYIDTERATRGRANNLDKETRTKVVKAFCKEVEAHDLEAGVYASKSWFYNQLNAPELEKYDIWCAQYNTDCDYTGKKNMWQFTSRGQVAGIEGSVDMNVRY